MKAILLNCINVHFSISYGMIKWVSTFGWVIINCTGDRLQLVILVWGSAAAGTSR